MKAQLFQRTAKPVVAQHEPIKSHPDYFAVLDVTDPAVVNQPDHVAHRIEFYRDWVLQHALQDTDWTFTPVTPGLLIEWLLDCPAWRSERGSYFTSTKQRIIKALVEQLLHLQQHATGAAKIAHPSHWDTAEFDRWFAGSKIVDKQGNPLQVFHGTNTGPGQDGWFSSGRFGYIYVTPDSNYAEGYGFGDGHKVYPLYAKAHNPLDLRRLGLEAYKVSFQAECKSHGLDFEVTDSAMVKPVFQWVRLPGFKEACEAKGYDAIWLRERDATGQADALLLFNSNQLKSAIGNRGTYDAEDPRITASKTADRKGRRQTFQGFSITVEYPSGSFRSGVAPDGTAWRKLMVHDYGHFVGIPAADGDSLDCYLGPDEDAEHAYVVNQLKQDGSFDEHKILLGFTTPQAALQGYLAHMPGDWTGFDPLKILSVAELRDWILTGDQMVKVAASFDAQDIPKNYWAAIMLGPSTFRDREFGQLGGIRGISASPAFKGLFKQVASRRGKTAAPDMDFQRWFKSIGGWDGIDNAWGDSWQDHYFERAAEEVDARDEQALKEQAREFIWEDLGDAYAHWDYKYHYLVHFPCKLFRAVDLDSPASLSTSGIGIYWTDSPSHAISHWGGSGSTYVLEAEVTEDAVDWDGTILANMDPSLGRDEQEIRLKAGARIKLLGYRGKNKGFGSPNEFIPLNVEAIA